MDNDIRYCISESLRLARSMPSRQMLNYLRGFLKLAGDNPAVDELRHVVTQISLCDAQLDLLQQPQLKLPIHDGGLH